MRKLAPILVIIAAALAASGCVERKLTVISTPPGARVYLDGEEKGITPVTFRFDWYGKREFLLRKDGYRTLREVRDVHEPFYERPVVNVVSDLTPLPLSDRKTIEFTLEPVGDVNRDDLMNRANEMKYRLEGQPIPARAKPEPAKPAEPTPEPAPKAEPGDLLPDTGPAPAPEPTPTPAPAPAPDDLAPDARPANP